MNVVPDWRAIRGRIVVAKDANALLLAQSRGENVGNQVGLRPVVFSAIFGGAGGIEITQGHEFHPISDVIGVKNAFHEQLGPAIGILRPFPALFRNGNFLRISINGGSGGEDETPKSRLNELAYQFDSVSDVILKIPGWIENGFPNLDQGCKMD